MGVDFLVSIFLSLRSNDFHDYVNWLIIRTVGDYTHNSYTAVWIFE